MKWRRKFISEFMSFFEKVISAECRPETIDHNTLQAIIVDDEYCLEGIPFVPGDTFIDIGAYIGGFSLFIASHVRDSRILAYEPLPMNVALIRKNADMNDFDNIQIFPIAVGGQQREIEMYWGDESSSFQAAHRFVGNSVASFGSKNFEVDMTTLPIIFNENNISKCKLIKIDAEGAELEILRSTPIEVLRRIDYIVGEHHGHPKSVVLEATKGVFEDVLDHNGVFSAPGNFWFRRLGV